MTDFTLPVISKPVPIAIRPTNTFLHNNRIADDLHRFFRSPSPSNPRQPSSAVDYVSSPQQQLPALPRGSERFHSLASLAREKTIAFAHRKGPLSSEQRRKRAHSATTESAFSRRPPTEPTLTSPNHSSSNNSKANAPESLDSSNELARNPKVFSQITSDPSSSTTNNMHQTSSRLLRMTEEDRPFTKDFKDLFSTLMVSLPLNTHRVRFRSYPFSFTSEEAISNLGSLKFSQSNRMPDPKDPSRIVTTTTTTTFSMAKEMARSVCQRFMEARFIETADGKPVPSFPLKGCTWVLTPKGVHVLDRFCQRNGINQEHVLKLLHSQYNTMRLVILERDVKTDKLSHDKTTVEIIFRRFAGTTPNIKAGSTMSDSDSLSDYSDGVTGVRLAESRKIHDKVYKNTFTGKCAVDWLLDCSTTVEKKEAHEICILFVQHGLIQSVSEDRVYIQQNPRGKDFQPTKPAIYVFTERGKRVAGWIESDRPLINGDKLSCDNSAIASCRDQRETNTTRLTIILADPALRLLFREYLRETVCEENLSFYLDVREFEKNFKAIDPKKPDSVRETLASAYGLYNAFLAPGSPCELNIDHTLRQDMASRMTRAVSKDENSMYESLKEVAALFERAQQQVFKLMAGDSVPKFIRTPKYIEVAGDIFDEERYSPSTPERKVKYN